MGECLSFSLCVVEGNHGVTRQLWQKILQIGKSALDLESLIVASNGIVKSLTLIHAKIQENLADIDVSYLPTIKDPDVLSLMRDLVSQQIPYVLIDLQGNDTEEAKASAKKLEDSFEALRECLNLRGLGQMEGIAKWIATLWVEEAQEGSLLVTPTTEPQDWLNALETSCSWALLCQFLWMNHAVRVT